MINFLLEMHGIWYNICRKRVVTQKRKTVAQLKNALAKISQGPDNSLNKVKKRFLKQAKQFLATASTIVEQQKDVYQRLPVKERIVSVSSASSSADGDYDGYGFGHRKPNHGHLAGQREANIR